jgi:uncharacterized protein
VNGPVVRAPTLIGDVASVRGGLVTVRLRDVPSTLVMVRGEAYRLGQIGSFLRIPLGYTQLYGVTTQVGADAAPVVADADLQVEESTGPGLVGYRWLSMALFGEAVGGAFERGVGRYPTIGDEVHLATSNDLDTIYRPSGSIDNIELGTIADSSGVPAQLIVSQLVSRHSCVFGSTGSGKSNLVAVILDELSGPAFPSARLLVVDPHGEYSSAVGERAKVISTSPTPIPGARPLRVPFWALPFDELISMTMGPLQPQIIEALRDRVRDMKMAAARKLSHPPPPESISADSPLPFSLRQLWFELQDAENMTFSASNDQREETRMEAQDAGDAATLRAPSYPPPTSQNTAPYPNRGRRLIGRQLDLLRTRLLDTRYSFMFDVDDPLHPDVDGAIQGDLADTLTEWIGGPEPVTILDVSGLPSEVLGTVVGTMLQLVYDALFWAMELPVGGRAQPLLVVVDEAHRFIPEKGASPATRTFARIAKEGRKYGVGLLLVTQRPSDLDGEVASQCGTVVALRVTNHRDRQAVAASIPDDLGGLVDLLPVLRTGEGLVLGEALQVPSRVRIRRAADKQVGDDPPLPKAWAKPERPDPAGYTAAVRNWRARSTGDAGESGEGGI